MPRRIGINAAGDIGEIVQLLKRTPLMRICTEPFYAEVPWRGQVVAELCGLIFDHPHSAQTGGIFLQEVNTLVSCEKKHTPRGQDAPPYPASCPRGAPTANGSREWFFSRSPAAAYPAVGQIPIASMYSRAVGNTVPWL